MKEKLPRPFYFLMISRSTLVFAVQMQAVLLGWQIYDFTHSAAQLGLIGLIEALPAISFALFAGQLIDQNEPLKFYKAVFILSFISIAVASLANQSSTHGVQYLYLSAFLTGLARSFASPAIQSMIPKLLKRNQLKAASALSTSAHKVSSILGPIAAGLLIAYKGYNFSYAFAAIILIIGFVSLFNIPKFPLNSQKQVILSKKFWTELFDGLHFVRKNKILLSTISLDLFAVLFGGVTALLPMFAVDVLHIGSQGLGMLRAAPGLGALAMSLYLSYAPLRSNEGRILGYSVFGFGLCILVFAFSTSAVLSFIALFFSGALDAISMVIRAVIVQLTSPDSMRGKIAAVNSIFISSSNEIGAFESGMAASIMGLIPSVIFGGSMTLIIVIAIYYMNPMLKNLNLQELED